MIFAPLRQIKKAGHATAIVAGGAIRDLWHNNPIRDIDIFIQYPPPDIVPDLPPDTFSHSSWINYWSDVFSGHNVVCNMIFTSYEQQSSNNKHPILAVWNMFIDDTNVQVVLTKIPPIRYVEDFFDFNICKAYSDGNLIRLTKEFMRDSLNRTITLSEKNMPPERVKHVIENHLPRIKAKYPDFSLIVPPNLKGGISAC